MTNEDEGSNIVCEPDFEYSGKYSYADYLNWTIEERVEIIKGKVFRMFAAPSPAHQGLTVNLIRILSNYLLHKRCEVFPAPFDVLFPKDSFEDANIFTVVQPDVCVICNTEKITKRGCMGAPDIIVEILSPSNNKKELRNKFDLYEETGVKEYWILSYQDKTFLPNVMNASGKYVILRPLTIGDTYQTEILPGLLFNMDEVFAGFSFSE